MRTHFFGSLAWRLTAWYAVASFGMIVLIAVISYYALLNAFSHETDGYLRDTAQQLQEINKQRSLKFTVEEELFSRSFLRLYARVIDDEGRVVAQTLDMQKFLPPDVFPAPAELTKSSHGADYYSESRDRIFRVMTIQITSPRKMIVQLACDRKRETGILKRYNVSVTAVLSVSFLLCAFGAYFIAKRGIKPVYKMVDATEQIGHGTLHERITIDKLPDELQQLASSFNAMLNRLEESFARISQFSEDIAHELRTPVNNLRGGMEVVLGKTRTSDEYCDAIGSALEECERLARLVDRLLFIARSENSDVKIERDPVDLRDELLKTQEFYEVNAEETGVTIAVDAPEGLRIPANRDLLRSLIGNLVSNAIAHTPAGGHIQLTAVEKNSGAVITVKDTGKGIPPEHVPHLFDRFYRVDRSRTKTSGGVGLGLAIVSTIAKLHGASLGIESVVGTGTSISVTFPAE